MTYDEQSVRDRLEEVARTAPPVRFGAADLVRRGRRRRQARRGALVAGAAAALALVVTVPTVALRGDSTGGVAGIDAAAPGSTRPATSKPPLKPTTAAPARLTVPGLTADQADRIARSCARSVAEDEASARVYGVVQDAAGLHALAYTRDSYLSCDVSGSPDRYTARAGSAGAVVLPWLPGAFGIDSSSSAEGGTPQKGKPGAPPAPGFVLTEGRVTSAVARLTVSFGDRSMQVRPQNHTYVSRLLFSTTWQPGPDDFLTITAYDARGGTLGSYQQAGPEPCYRTPAGQVITGKTAVPTPDCKLAQRWR